MQYSSSLYIPVRYPPATQVKLGRKVVIFSASLDSQDIPCKPYSPVKYQILQESHTRMLRTNSKFKKFKIPSADIYQGPDCTASVEAAVRCWLHTEMLHYTNTTLGYFEHFLHSHKGSIVGTATLPHRDSKTCRWVVWEMISAALWVECPGNARALLWAVSQGTLVLAPSYLLSKKAQPCAH